MVALWIVTFPKGTVVETKCVVVFDNPFPLSGLNSIVPPDTL